MNKQDVIDSLGALAHVIRLDVFRALVVAGQDGLTPGALIEMLGVPSAKLSFHLKELASAGLVTQQQVGRHIVYRADYQRMDAVLGYLTDQCCKGSPRPVTIQDSDAACGQGGC